MSSAALEQFEELLETFQTAMFVSTSLEGQLRGRPMAIAGYEDELLFFASRAEDEKLREILKHPNVAITLQDCDRYLSISGRARLETDTVLADRLWSASMTLWFPDGPEDENLVLIIVEPLRGEYWDRSGALRLEFLWEAGKALLQGKKLPESRLSGHAKVGTGEN